MIELLRVHGIIGHEVVIVEENLVELRIVHLLHPLLHMRHLNLIIVRSSKLDDVGLARILGWNFVVTQALPVLLELCRVNAFSLLPGELKVALLVGGIPLVYLHLIQPLGKDNRGLRVVLASSKEYVSHIELQIVEEHLLGFVHGTIVIFHLLDGVQQLGVLFWVSRIELGQLLVLIKFVEVGETLIRAIFHGLLHRIVFFGGFIDANEHLVGGSCGLERGAVLREGIFSPEGVELSSCLLDILIGKLLDFIFSYFKGLGLLFDFCEFFLCEVLLEKLVKCLIPGIGNALLLDLVANHLLHGRNRLKSGKTFLEQLLLRSIVGIIWVLLKRNVLILYILV